FRPLHLVTTRAQSLTQGRILRVRIEGAAAKEHDLDEEPNGPAISKPVLLGPGDCFPNDCSQVFGPENLTKLRREALAVGYHFVLERQSRCLLESCELLRADDHLESTPLRDCDSRPRIVSSD